MRKDVCIPNCKFNKRGSCSLYHATLGEIVIPDPELDRDICTHLKCEDCMEKELSCSIDDKIRDITTFYSCFTEEMDLLIAELDVLVKERKDIYEEE